MRVASARSLYLTLSKEERSGYAEGDRVGLLKWLAGSSQKSKDLKIALHPWMQNKGQLRWEMHTSVARIPTVALFLRFKERNQPNQTFLLILFFLFLGLCSMPHSPQISLPQDLL